MADLELKGFRGLRDLESLISASKPTATTAQSLRYLSIDSLQSGKYQPRKDLVEESLSELTASIKAQGILQPLIVRQIQINQYEIIAGERRWRAAKKAELKEVPVIVRNVEDNAALAFALIENIQRENLNPIEEALAFLQLKNEFSMTHEQVAKTVGRSRAMVSNLLRLLHLAEPVKKMLLQKKLEMGHARALLSLDEKMQTNIAKMVVDKKLNVRETERLIQRISKPPSAEEMLNPRFDLMAKNWEQRLSKRLSSKANVCINNKGQGRVTIHFNSPDEMDWLVGRVEEE